ncbi:hypothetical protein PIB30_071521 [Stylosanthes scabra]|uniref:Uncharacterized protein n=1 Tax=Stylosanthes scabra TaxID=79078 RepID=A0ABU6YLD5_9FABA|nr:hypothetical protein [Stylosanthes scabra]
MGSGVIYYEYEKRENVRFDPDRPYEFQIEALMADKILSASKDEKSSTKRPRSSRRLSLHYSPRIMPVAQRERSTLSIKGTRSFRRAKLLFLMSQWRQLTDSPLVVMVRVTICPEFGSLSRRVQVLRVPRLPGESNAVWYLESVRKCGISIVGAVHDVENWDVTHILKPTPNEKKGKPQVLLGRPFLKTGGFEQDYHDDTFKFSAGKTTEGFQIVKKEKDHSL